MKLTLPRLTTQKGSSIAAQVPVTLDAGENLTNVRLFAYIKRKGSDKRPLCSLDASYDADKSVINLSVGPPRSDAIPAGQMIYYVELIQGMNIKMVEKNFLNVEP